jgi:hypothetical protein
VHKFLARQLEVAKRRIEAALERRRVWKPMGSVTHRWSGEVRDALTPMARAACVARRAYTPQVRRSDRSLNVLDAYVAEASATNKLVGGRQGAWVIADFDHRVLRPAMQALTAGDDEGETVVTGGSVHKEVSRLNSTTITYTGDVCLDIRVPPAADTPAVTFKRMKVMCM